MFNTYYTSSQLLGSILFVLLKYYSTSTAEVIEDTDLKPSGVGKKLAGKQPITFEFLCRFISYINLTKDDTKPDLSLSVLMAFFERFSKESPVRYGLELAIESNCAPTVMESLDELRAAIKLFLRVEGLEHMS
jgi:hypothetical protein